MTLYKQLLGYTCIMLLCLGIGLWLGELTRTRNFLRDQLASHAQDTATSLGLSLSRLADATDIPAMESMVSALFDRGFYRRIQLYDLNNQVLVNRTTEIAVKGVPTWFVSLLPLAAPQAEALIMHGWRQTGTVIVESHPGYAYKTLWQSALTVSLFFTGTLLVVALLGALSLRRLLRPLNDIEAQAVALGERRFHILPTLPRTRELRRVVIAMNTTTERLRAMFREQAAIADELMQRAYQDTLTTLGNRRFLEAQILAKVTSRTTECEGAFLLAQIQGLNQLNQRQGYEAGDALIKETAEILRQACGDVAEPIMARLGGGDFALLLLNISPSEAKKIGDTIIELHNLAETGREYGLVCGGVALSSALTSQALLAAADQALTTARYTHDPCTVLLAPGDRAVAAMDGRQTRKTALETMLANRAVALYCQPTVQHGDLRDIVHYEILTRMVDHSGAHVSIGTFIPIAEQFGLMPVLDRLILEQLLEIPVQSLLPSRVAVNLSPLSLEDADFLAWLQSWLKRCSDRGLAINFEFPEFLAVRHRRTISQFAAQIKELGHGIGIDHFGQGLLHFGYLKSLLPNYVKIDRAITHDLWNEYSDSYFFVNALCTVAHSLDIRVMVEGIETEAQWRAISKIHLDAVQGFFIQQPEQLHLCCHESASPVTASSKGTISRLPKRNLVLDDSREE